MNRHTPAFDQRIADWLEADPAAAPADVLSTVVAAIPSIPQARRGLLAPWRFPNMSSLSSTVRTVLVGTMLLLAAGGGAYLLTGGGGVITPSPAPPTASPAPTPGGPGISSFTTYTSEAYGITFGYPDGWRVYAAAERKWQTGATPDDPYYDIFSNPKDRDGDDIVFFVWQEPAGSNHDIRSREGLAAWAEAELCARDVPGCETASDEAEPMCAGQVACGPALLIPWAEGIEAFFVDTETGWVTVVSLLRHDTFAQTARYGGGVQLVKSILTTMDVWTPGPGQIPAGT